jgi:putative DNA-invertase from lambdoid prophage Rac
MGHSNPRTSKPKTKTSSLSTTQVAIYCRVSTTDQSCERQERDLKAFAKRAGYNVLEVFKETASGTRNDRLERTKVIKLARDRRINAVLITELTRWGRSTSDLLSSLQELEGYGVSVIAQTGLQFDLGSPQGK